MSPTLLSNVSPAPRKTFSLFSSIYFGWGWLASSFFFSLFLIQNTKEWNFEYHVYKRYLISQIILFVPLFSMTVYLQQNCVIRLFSFTFHTLVRNSGMEISVLAQAVFPINYRVCYSNTSFSNTIVNHSFV